MPRFLHKYHGRLAQETGRFMCTANHAVYSRMWHQNAAGHTEQPKNGKETCNKVVTVDLKSLLIYNYYTIYALSPIL